MARHDARMIEPCGDARFAKKAEKGGVRVRALCSIRGREDLLECDLAPEESVHRQPDHGLGAATDLDEPCVLTGSLVGHVLRINAGIGLRRVHSVPSNGAPGSCAGPSLAP